MKLWKRMTGIGVAALLLFATACGGTGSNLGASGDAPTGERALYTIKVLVTSTGNTIVKRSDETPVGKVIKDKFNIVFEFIPFSGDYRDKLNMMLASGDYPEMLRVERQDLVTKYINAGAALPLDDYLKDAKYFNEANKPSIPFWRLPASDGKLYKWEANVPQDVNNFCECNDIAIRNDILKEQGYPKLLSTDDYVEFLKKAIAAHPTTNGKKTLGVVAPLAESWGMAGIMPIMYEKGDKYISVGNEGVIFNIKDQKFEDMLLNAYTKESYQFFNRLYREGLLDNESFTDTLTQVTEKVNSGQALGFYYTMWIKDQVNTSLEKAGHPDLGYIQLPIQTNTMVKEGQKKNLRLETVRPYDSIIITKNAKDPKRIFELIDWFSSEEGQILLQAGVEGVHYKRVDGKRVLTDEFKKGYREDPNYLSKQGIGVGMSFLGLRLLTAKDNQPYNLLNDTAASDEFSLTKTVADTYKTLGWANSKDWFRKNGVPAPGGLASGIIIDPTSSEGMISQKIVELRVKNSAKLVMAKSEAEFEQIWQDLMKQYQVLNPQKVVDKYNEIFQQQQAKVKEYTK
ncbi:ABC-type glycerol-3-phosphate transport system, substrate-binding protein [Paenibacillus tianmuensis]|uniref:ABC-type glycerol-3-phosphate transport system, substrate-binding protein n=1 Tax=Paenibacillus tianmuensis TaxID=624147 RepID=A0A1G4PLZ9_9BACL|nr:extracellular solute-binding protein [Paenibacillus tianmuensis]SCW33205.1 ABC-type glycerol-3-phosphate transport system, substrate-binding protein [Paenibacillus tianmuensis]